jgi:amino acid transporter
MMGPFSIAVEMLRTYWVFTFLAYLVLLILLHYLFKYLLEKHVKRIKKENRRKALAAVLSIIVVALLILVSTAFVSTAVAYVTGAVFILLVVFVVIAAAAGLLGIELPSLLKKLREDLGW